MPEDKKKEEIKSEIKDLILNEDIENDVNKIHEKKEHIEYVDKFNYWIYVGFITLGVLLILSIILLIYTIFFNKTIITETTNKKIFTPSVANESIQIPNQLDDTKSSKSIFSSLFSSSPSKPKEIVNIPTIDTNNTNNTTIDTNRTNNNSSLFSSLLSSFKTKKTNDNIPTVKPTLLDDIKTTDVETLNKNILKAADENKKSDSIFTSILSPLYKRKVDLPNMKYTGGTYNKILKRL